MTLKIKGIEADILSDDFCIFVKGKTVIIPKKVLTFFENKELHTIEEFVSLAHIFPSCIAHGLNMSVFNVEIALARLLPVLEAHVDTDILYPSAPPKRI